MRSTSIFPERGALAVALAVGLVAGVAHAQTFPVLAGDPVDPATQRAYAILPGEPLILPQANGKYDPPIVVQGTVGDVDLVVRAGQPAVGATMPPPAAVPPTATAGGTRVVDGTEIPFTVIASDGSGGVGAPLLGSEMDGLPAIVFAFADLDGDGFVGPTDADPAGAADDLRERQESDFVVGRTAAIFVDGVARGSIAVWRGAPASSGGLRVVLTAAAYVGPFTAGFMLGNVPDGPPISTLLPFFPRFDPDKVVDAKGNGGPAGPEVRLGVTLEGAFDPPIGDPVLGTPFALPTDGSSPTIDRAVVVSGAVSRFRFVRPSVAAGFPLGTQMALLPGAGGALFEPATGVTIADDGPGNAVEARLVPVDLFDNVADPAPGLAATLVAGPGLRIVSPDADADPAVETVPVASAAGVVVSLDDAGGAGDGPAATTLTVLRDGLPVEVLAITLQPGGGTTTTTTTTTVTVTSTTGGSTTSAPVTSTTTGGSTTSAPVTTTTLAATGSAPAFGTIGIAGEPIALAVGCHATRTLVAFVSDPDGDLAAVSASVTLGGAAPLTVPLVAGAAPGDPFTGTLDVDPTIAGLLTATFRASDVAGHSAPPVSVSVPVATSVAPAVGAPDVTPRPVAGTRTTIAVTAEAHDDCGLKRVLVQIDRGRGFKKLARLRDDGRHGDGAAGDGVYGATKRVKLPAGAVGLRTTARNVRRLDATSAAVTLQVAP